ncbi:MAG: TetR/AcrR family transcriptional regulator [Proteobacteria bacterium]|nr:TetR/AcrR family transcriptional regulator [Pseudomonadota bacterium]
MARPSRNLDLPLLQAGLQLYPQLGSAGLSVRGVAEHAGVASGMFHYHFKSKNAFLEQVLQQFYEDVFAQLSARAHEPGTPLARLGSALGLIARLLREHAAMLRRLLADLDAGQPVVVDFVRRNLPRHVGLLLGLLDEAERAGQIAPRPPLTRLSFVMGAVVAPVLVLPRIESMGVGPADMAPLIGPQVLSDAAIDMRIAMALQALQQPDAGAPTPENLP